MITLSYSTINMIYKASHNWLNKQMGLKPETRIEWDEGKKAHRIIQDHVSGKLIDERLKHITFTFPVVETVDFDERTKFVIPINTKYAVRGFADGLNKEEKRLLEIKSSSTPWSIGKFLESKQRKIYSLGFPYVSEAILITCLRHPDQWILTPPKVMKLAMTNKDRDEAMEWILGAINIIEKGEFNGGLENGKCLDPFCYYGRNCAFK